MASRRGVAVTAMVLAGITAGSFVIWLVPEGRDATFVITDYEGYLDGAKSVHEVLQESVGIEYRGLLEGTVTPDEYAATAEIVSSQVTAQIGEFVTSKPPEQWQPSYVSHMESMRKFGEYVGETRVVAGLIEEGAPQHEIDAAAERAEEIMSESVRLAAESDGSRP